MSGTRRMMKGNNTMVMRKAMGLIFGSGLVLLATGCPLLQVEVEARGVCLNYPDLQFDVTAASAAAGAGVGAMVLEKTFEFDELGPLAELVELNAEIVLDAVELTAQTGIADFAFVDTATVKLASGDPESTLPELTAYRCAGDCEPEGNGLTVPPAATDNVLPYAGADSILVHLTLDGPVPVAAGSLDVSVCLNASASESFAP